MYRPGNHIYLAAPFFNDEQKELCDFIEEMHNPMSSPIYSPRLDGGVLKPDSNKEEIKDTFDSNKLAIDMAAWVLAVIDDFDPGVIWEIGYAHAKGMGVLGYSDVPGRGLNVMLAGSCNLGFVNGRRDLADVFQKWRQIPVENAFPRNTWSGEIQ